MAADIAGQSKDHDQDFIRVSCHSLSASVHDEALGWVRALAGCMREMDVATLTHIRDKVHKYDVALHRHPETLDELKAVLATVATIRNEGAAMELKYADLEERYRTRLLYASSPAEAAQCAEELTDAQQVRDKMSVREGAQAPPAPAGRATMSSRRRPPRSRADVAVLPRPSRGACTQLRVTWQALVDEADRVDWSLEDTKKLFSETTRAQVADFATYTAELWERFKDTGPGLPTIELPRGLELLHEFQGELDTALKQREQLVLAEKLFDMPITSYPHLSQLEAAIKQLQQARACPGGDPLGSNSTLLGGLGEGCNVLTALCALVRRHPALRRSTPCTLSTPTACGRTPACCGRTWTLAR